MEKKTTLILCLVFLNCQLFNGEDSPQLGFAEKLKIYKSQNLNSDYIFIAAHRGDWRNAPENSLLGMQFCIDAGIDIMETDLKLTKDSILILMHDNTLDRTTNGRGLVKDYTYDSISKLNLKNGLGVLTSEKVPSLTETLRFAKGKIMIDLDKSYPYLKLAYKIAKETETLGQVIFRINDDYPTFYSKYSDIINKINYMPMLSDKEENPNLFLNDYLQSSYPPSAIEVIAENEESRVLNLLDTIRHHDVRIMMNSVYPHISAGHTDDKAINEPENNWGWLLNQGTSVLGTDRPRLLSDYLKKRRVQKN